MMLLAECIDALLPQTQCTRCGYPACRDYAEAIACGEADINQCPPGGTAGIAAMAGLLNRAVKPLNPVNGVEKPREIALHRRSRMHRLHQVHPGVPGRCDRWRIQIHAHRARRGMHRLRVVRCRPVRSIASRWCRCAATAADPASYRERHAAHRLRLRSRLDDERAAEASWPRASVAVDSSAIAAPFWRPSPAPGRRNPVVPKHETRRDAPSCSAVCARRIRNQRPNSNTPRHSSC